MNALKQVFERYGLTLADAVKAGCPYHALYKQLKGERAVGVVCALRYHKALGIPLSDLRPDLWPPEPPGQQPYRQDGGGTLAQGAEA